MIEGIRKLFRGQAENAAVNQQANALPQHNMQKEFSLRDVLSAFTNTNLATADQNFGKKKLAFNLNADALAVVTFLSGQESTREHARMFLPEVQEEIIRQLPAFDAVDVNSLTVLLKQLDSGKQPIQYKKFVIDDWYHTHQALLGRSTVTLAFQRLVPEQQAALAPKMHIPN